MENVASGLRFFLERMASIKNSFQSRILGIFHHYRHLTTCTKYLFGSNALWEVLRVLSCFQSPRVDIYNHFPHEHDEQ